jgi:uncharacterized protein (DUF608 family)
VIPTSRESSRDVPHLALPLGGLGTGNVAIHSDGSLRQWQLHNIGNHAGALPFSFFGLRISRIEPPLDTFRVLQAPLAESTNTPLVTDDVAPQWMHDVLSRHRGFAETTVEHAYPFATVRYLDRELPVDISLEAFTPLSLLDADESALPVAMFTFRVKNTDSVYVRAMLGAALQNAVGWDGISPIDGVRAPGYGGNTNRVERHDGWTSIVMENAGLPSEAPGNGQMLLAVDDPLAPVARQWRTPDEFVAFMNARGLADAAGRTGADPHQSEPQRNAPTPYAGPSPEGSTWNAGLLVRLDLQPGDERVVRMVVAWSFPNRYVNFEQFGPTRPEWGSTRFWLGNRYTEVHGDAQQVQRRVAAEWDELRAAAWSWAETLLTSTLDEQAARHLGAQVSLVRSPTTFQAADGRFFGFEGTCGASTVMWSGAFGGSCPMNCTHVWNYEHALAKTYPALERSMRETEFDVMQSPEGFIPHRVILPVYLRQLWDDPIGGPEEPALDGMLGTVLKTYREYRNGAGDKWLAGYWPRIVLLLDHIEGKWANEDALLTGIQPSTHDIDLSGLNSFMGTLWLAALRAAEEMATIVGDERAAHYRSLFERGSAAYDAELWNGEYYVQKLLPGDDDTFQWVDGCLSDQLIGQWWAHQLDLGYLLPEDRVRSALEAVVRHNFRDGFHGFEHPFRVYADGDDAGLVMCTWPADSRPETPLRYADEVWTGIEYQVAAHCFWEGLDDLGWQIARAIWARHDGSRRNPYNEIECGDHYARAMAGWSLLEAIHGFRHDASTGSLSFREANDGDRFPFLCSTGWGQLVADGGEVRLECHGGRVELSRLEVGGALLHDEPVVVEPGRPFVKAQAYVD